MLSVNMLQSLTYVLLLLCVSTTGRLGSLAVLLTNSQLYLYICASIPNSSPEIKFFFLISLEIWELRGIRDSGFLISWCTIAERRMLLTFTSFTVLHSAMQMGCGFHCALWTWLVWCKIGFGICVSLLINGGKLFALCCHSSFESISREPWFFLCEAALHFPTRQSVWKMNF